MTALFSSAAEAWAFGAALVMAAGALTAVLALLLAPLLRKYALARPNARSSHVVPTPQGGGIAVIAATIAVALSAGIGVSGFGANNALYLTPLLAAVFLAIVGAIDDIRTLAAGPRLLLQAVAVGAAIAVLPPELQVLPAIPWWIERSVLLLAGLWFVNLTNFMDGIDGMTVAELVPVTGGLVAIGLLGALPPFAIVITLCLCGALLGFAPFNLPAARLFLGDVGSLPLGLLLGWLLLLLALSGHFAAAVILPLYYLADATITLVRRALAGENLSQAHRRHFYQQAFDGGWSAPRIAGRVFAVNLALVVFAAATVAVPHPAVITLALAVSAGLVGWLLYSFARVKR